MRWQVKAAVQATSSVIPKGDTVYQRIQTRFGNLGARPMARLPYQVQMTAWLQDAGVSRDATFFEVGTGHIPVLPIGFYLCGAAKVYTVDLYSRLRLDFTGEVLTWLASNSQTYVDLLPEDLWDTVAERLETVSRYRDDPLGFLRAANIEYLAPCDAAAAPLPDGAVDVHFSCNVFEHVPLAVLGGIMSEADRLLGPQGRAIHFVDPSDHFQHGDSRITKINFLKYEDRTWKAIAGNRFGYANRARVTDYQSMFDAAGFVAEREELTVDPESRAALSAGFKVASPFAGLSEEVLSTTYYKVLLKRKGILTT